MNRIALEYKDKALDNNNISNNKFEEIEKIVMELKLKYKETQEYIIVNNENSYKKFEYLAKEIFNLQNRGNENSKLLNIINRKIHNNSKRDNAQ
jgi:signal recognition particle subunit SEC65